MFWLRTSGGSTSRARAATLASVALLVAAVTAGCGAEQAPPPEPPLLLSGPDTNAVVTIPDGWHQVINSANPAIPEMVAPVDCMGSNEVGCATGLARVATTTAPSVQDAARAVSDAVTGEPGVTRGPTVSEGPARVGQRGGYRQRFQFRNARSGQTAEVAAVPSGQVVPDAEGNREFSIVLVWITDLPGAPPVSAIDQIVDSTLVRGGESPR